MSIERIAEDNWQANKGHVYRYQLAADWLKDSERVLDVACGIGYGARIIAEKKMVNYWGIDKVQASGTFQPYGTFIDGVNLDDWKPQDEWDVSISFETLEHVEYPNRLAANLKKANRLVILSTPTRPTKHLNPYHLHDFTLDDVLGMFDGCELIHLEDQPEELSHIFVFSTKR